MARGFLSGVVAGGLVSAIGAGGLSLAIGDVHSNTPEATALEVPAGSGFNSNREDQAAEVPAQTAHPASNAAAPLRAPEPDTITTVGEAAQNPSAAPSPGASGQTLADPSGPNAAPQVLAGDEAPVSGPAAGAAPASPQTDPLASISTEPAQPVQPDAGDGASALPTAPLATLQAPQAEAAPSAGGAAPGIAVDAEAGPAPQAAATTAPELGNVDTAALSSPSLPAPAADTPSGAPADPAPAAQAGAPEQPAPAVQIPEDSQPPAPDTPSAGNIDQPQVQTAPAPAPAAQPQAPSSPAPGSAPQAPAAPAAPPADPVEPESEAPAVESARPSIGKPASTLANLAPNVRTNRLPTTSAPAPAPETATETAVEAPENLPPIQAFAAEIEVTEDKPLMSIVLIDDGPAQFGADAVQGFPFPVTVAIDAAEPDAAQRMANYRALGLEVMAMANLPEGAAATDAEVFLQTALDTVPEAVAVLEGAGTGLQGSRSASEQVIEILATTGHGLVTFPKGLNTAVTLAEKSGIPAAAVFRDFDGEGQTPRVMRRFLDQAAFKARQEGGVIMVGRLSANTISALLLWGLQDRASRVALLVPVSAVLTR